jgi:hypothetical protein
VVHVSKAPCMSYTFHMKIENADTKCLQNVIPFRIASSHEKYWDREHQHSACWHTLQCQFSVYINRRGIITSIQSNNKYAPFKVGEKLTDKIPRIITNFVTNSLARYKQNCYPSNQVWVKTFPRSKSHLEYDVQLVTDDGNRFLINFNFL